jgi:hypothetical protein
MQLLIRIKAQIAPDPLVLLVEAVSGLDEPFLDLL